MLRTHRSVKPIPRTNNVQGVDKERLEELKEMKKKGTLSKYLSDRRHKKRMMINRFNSKPGGKNKE